MVVESYANWALAESSQPLIALITAFTGASSGENKAELLAFSSPGFQLTTKYV